MATATFANTLRALREQAGLSRADLATAAGLSYPYVSQLETGLRKPSRKAAADLARALSIEPLAFEATIPADESDPRDVSRSTRESARVIAGHTSPTVEAPAVWDVVHDDLVRRITDLVEQIDPDARIDLLADVQREVLHRLVTTSTRKGSH